MEIDLPKEIVFLHRRGAAFGAQRVEPVNETARYFLYFIAIGGRQGNIQPVQIHCLQQLGFKLQYYSYIPKVRCEFLDKLGAEYLGMYVDETINSKKGMKRCIRPGIGQGNHNIMPKIKDPRLEGKTFNESFMEQLFSGEKLPEKGWENVGDILTRTVIERMTKERKKAKENVASIDGKDY